MGRALRAQERAAPGSARDGRPVLLTQVARVEEGAQVKRGDTSANATAAVILSAQTQPEGPAAGASGLERKYRESRGSSPRRVKRMIPAERWRVEH